MKILLLLAVGWAMPDPYLCAQMLSHQLVGSGGGAASAGGYFISQTIGELDVTLLASPTQLLTQGFQQPEFFATSDVTAPPVAFKAMLSPNPTGSWLTLDIMADQLLQFEVTVYDLGGKSMGKSAAQTGASLLDFSTYAPGVYIVTLRSANGSGGLSARVVKQN